MQQEELERLAFEKKRDKKAFSINIRAQELTSVKPQNLTRTGLWYQRFFMLIHFLMFTIGFLLSAKPLRHRLFGLDKDDSEKFVKIRDKEEGADDVTKNDTEFVDKYLEREHSTHRWAFRLICGLYVMLFLCAMDWIIRIIAGRASARRKFSTRAAMWRSPMRLFDVLCFTIFGVILGLLIRDKMFHPKGGK